MPSPPDSPDFLQPPQSEGELGRFGPYRVIELLGQGGMGQVYRAEDTRLQRTVAIKLMNPRFAATPHNRQRFVDEARSMAAVEHDNVATIFEVGQQEGTPYLAMELLQGKSLEQLLTSGRRFDFKEVLSIADQVAKGLQAAHDREIIHRDIKPANLWVQSPGERIKILDFGLAVAGSSLHALGKDESVIGTPGYLAPEQARNEPVDERTDLYSLGVVMYELCAGKVPLMAGNTPAHLVQIVCRNPPPLSEQLRDGRPVRVPEPIEALIMRLLSKEAGDRFETAKELQHEIQRVTESISAQRAAELNIRVQSDDVPATTQRAKRGARQSEHFNAKGGFQAVHFVIAAVAALFLIGGGVWWVLSGGQEVGNPGRLLAKADAESPGVLAATLKPLRLTGKVVADAEVPVGQMARFRIQLTNEADSAETDPRVLHARVGQVARITTYLQQPGQPKRKAPAFPKPFSPRQLPAPGETQTLEVQFLTTNLAQEKYDVLFELQSPAGALVSSLATKLIVTENLQQGDLLGFKTVRTWAGVGADTFVRRGTQDDFGKQPTVAVHRSGGDDGNVLDVAFLRFDLSQLDPPAGMASSPVSVVLNRIDRAALVLSMGEDSIAGEGEVSVYGWPDSAGAGDWIESGEGHMHFATSPIADGIDELVPLGTFRFANDQEALKNRPDGIRFVSKALDEFLRSSRGVVTLGLSPNRDGEKPARFNTRDKLPELAPGLAIRWRSDD